MKKLVLFLPLVSLFGSASAQINFIIEDANATNVTGTTQTFWIDQDNLDSRNFYMLNTSAGSITVKVRRTIIQLNTPTAYSYFCNCITCFSPATNLSPVFTISPGTPCILTPDYFPDSTGGTGIVRYTILDQTTAADSVSFDIVYNPGPAGINSNALVKPSISNPAPNPASSFFNVNYKLGNANVAGAKMIVYDLLGNRIMETAVEEMEGTVRMDVSTLEQGIYFCSLEANGKMLATHRLVVAH